MLLKKILLTFFATSLLSSSDVNISSNLQHIVEENIQSEQLGNTVTDVLQKIQEGVTGLQKTESGMELTNRLETAVDSIVETGKTIFDQSIDFIN